MTAGIVSSANAAHGQPLRCGERQPIVNWLEETFKEERTSAGLSKDGELVEVFVAPSGTWTILLSYPSGLTCILRAGDAWQDYKLAEDGPLT